MPVSPATSQTLTRQLVTTSHQSYSQLQPVSALCYPQRSSRQRGRPDATERLCLSLALPERPRVQPACALTLHHDNHAASVDSSSPRRSPLPCFRLACLHRIPQALYLISTLCTYKHRGYRQVLYPAFPHPNPSLPPSPPQTCRPSCRHEKSCNHRIACLNFGGYSG